jgi:multidrug efflux system outer membrane protein
LVLFLWRKCFAALVALSAVTLSACSVGPTYQRPDLPIPATWRDDQAQAPAWPSADWWRGFGSPQLDSLIAQAQADNLDLAAAVARIREADAQARIAGAALLPAVDAGAGVTRSRRSRNVTSGTAGGAGTASGGGTTGGVGGKGQNLYDAQLSASYEIDFWGKNHAALESAKDTALASRYSEQTVALTTMSSVATTYFQILQQRDVLAVTEQNLTSAEDILKALQAQEAAGIANALDVAQQETTVATLRASIPPLQQQERQFIDALAILVGKPPEAVDITSGTLGDLAHPTVSPGLPSELLARRPDVAMAEAQLMAANANITVARAAFFPSVQLTAQGGIESAALSSLFGPASLFYSVGSSVTQPIFEGGALEGQYEFSKAFRDELVQTYRKSVISAFQNVEDALVATQQTAEQEQRQQVAVDTAERAFQVATAQLNAGTINVLTLLNTETALFTARTTLAQVRSARLQAIVSLFIALGGGWQQTGGSSA